VIPALVAVSADGSRRPGFPSRGAGVRTRRRTRRRRASPDAGAGVPRHDELSAALVDAEVDVDAVAALLEAEGARPERTFELEGLRRIRLPGLALDRTHRDRVAVDGARAQPSGWVSTSKVHPGVAAVREQVRAIDAQVDGESPPGCRGASTPSPRNRAAGCGRRFGRPTPATSARATGAGNQAYGHLVRDTPPLSLDNCARTLALCRLGHREALLPGKRSSISSPSSASSLALARISSCLARSREKAEVLAQLLERHRLCPASRASR